MLVFLFAYLLALGAANQKDGDDKQTTKSLWRLFIDVKQTQMVLITEENGYVSDCYVSGDE